MTQSNEDWVTRDEELLHAYHDGELSGFARRRFERRLERSSALRRDLESLSEIGTALRALDGEAETPDVWDDVALRLPALDARAAEAPRSWRKRRRDGSGSLSASTSGNSRRRSSLNSSEFSSSARLR